VPEGTPEYGTPRQGAVSVLGVHYSRQPREYLSGLHHGQGLKDAADERLSEPGTDPRLKSRIYFYVDEGHGIVPEAGVGGVKHTVLLKNIYDPQMDHGAVWSRGKGDANASEKAVLDAGYDGYYVRNFANQSGVAVLLGDHTVKVKQEVQKDDLSEDDLQLAGLKTPDGNKPKKKKTQDIGPDIALKFDPSAPSVLPFSSFVDSAGRTFFNMASSLHTSRLSAFGFTAEADYLGIKQYQIDEQLDGRTCPVCEYMDGKVFDVEDARGFLDMVVRTQDADELKTLQPWPSQSKAGIETLKGLSSDELVMSGWHVPPFHPHCRGLLSAAEKASPTKQPEQQTTPQGPYAATAEDFNQLGVQLSPARIEKWNQLMGASPASVIATLTGQAEQDVIEKAMQAAQDSNADVKEALGLMALSVDSHGRINIELQRSLSLAGGAEASALMDLYFNPNRNLFIGSVELSGAQYDSLYLGLRETLMDVYASAEQTGMHTIEAYAGSDLGGLAMAKYGFAPSEQGWDHLKDVIKRRLSKTAIASMLTAEEANYVDAILASPDPQDIFALADLPDVASALLEGTNWQGFLDINDPESVARFLTYLSETDEEAAYKWDPDQPREPAGSSKGGQWAKTSLAAQKAKEPYLYPKKKPVLPGDPSADYLKALFPDDAKPVDGSELEKAVEEVQAKDKAKTDAIANEGAPVNQNWLYQATVGMEAIIAKIDQDGEVMKKEALDNIHKLFNESVLQINVRSQDVMDAILADGRFKSQFETHTSMGLLDNDRRASVEAELFGFGKKHIKDSDRPIYGTLQSPWDPQKDQGDDMANNYGNVIVRLKPEVKDRATFTADDSLGKQYVPSRVKDPQLASFIEKYEMSGGPTEDNAQTMSSRLGHLASAVTVSHLGSSYVEAQVHGGVKASDISDIWIPTHSDTIIWSPAARDAIKTYGIKVHTYKGSSYAYD
jgi:hypothetical protein